MNRKRILFIVLDGLGDRPISALNGLTPLESARTPNLNMLAENAQCGLLDPLGVGVRPGSDVAVMNLLGYQPSKYYCGRGSLEAMGLHMNLKQGDVCLRVDFATVDSQMKVTDRRAGRIGDVSVFEKELNKIKVGGASAEFKAGVGHRGALVFRGSGLSTKISDTDPQVVGKKPNEVKPTDNTVEAKNTSNIVAEYLKKANAMLKKHPENKKRVKQKLLAANCILVRGAGIPPIWPDFKEKTGLSAACVAAGALEKGIARAAGMDVISVSGATGKSDTDLVAKAVAAKKALTTHEFVFLHIKATDNFGHDGDYAGKRNFIERIDSAFREFVSMHNVLVVVTGDHSTPCEMGAHSGDPLPIMFSGDNSRKDAVKKFGERECTKGIEGRISGVNLLDEMLNLAGWAAIRGS